MAQFEYQGFDRSGKNVRGKLVIENVAAAKQKLKSQGIFTSEIREIHLQIPTGDKDKLNISGFFNRVSSEELANMTRQLSTLVGSHIPLLDCLTALVDQVEHQQLRGVLSEIKSDVNEGTTFHKALAKFPHIFSDLYINMVASGEASGALDVVLVRLADFLEYQDRLKKKINASLAYPIIMLVVAFVAVLIIFTKVIPEIAKVFEDNRYNLPFITQVVLAMSNFLIAYWWAMIGLMVLTVYLIRRYLKTDLGRRKFDETVLKLPIFGPLIRMIAISRFSQTLSTLLRAGITLLPSLNVVKNVVGNITIKEAIEKATTDLSEGASIATPLRNSGQFPPLVTHMISVGEKTGELEAMLEKVAEHYEYQVNVKVQNFTSLIEPIMIVILAGVVLVIVLSVILPMLEMNNAAF